MARPIQSFIGIVSIASLVVLAGSCVSGDPVPGVRSYKTEVEKMREGCPGTTIVTGDNKVVCLGAEVRTVEKDIGTGKVKLTGFKEKVEMFCESIDGVPITDEDEAIVYCYDTYENGFLKIDDGPIFTQTYPSVK